MEDTFVGVIVGYMAATIIALLIVTFNPANQAEMCSALADNGHSVVYVDDLNECRYLTESGELLPFEILPVE